MNIESLKPALSIVENTNYISPIQSIKNVQISEWDIHSAGFSVLKFRKLLPESELEALSKLDKHTRTVKEGLLQKARPEIATEIIETLKAARQGFILMNQIPADSILSIKKDALFLINQNPKISIIREYFEFVKKNTYTSYIQLPGKREFYFNSNTNILDVKGISKVANEKQQEFLISDIKKLFRSWEKVSPELMYSLLVSYRKKYLNRELPLEAYRELDTGLFRIKNYTAENVGEDLRYEIDVTQNYMNYILPLIQILL